MSYLGPGISSQADIPPVVGGKLYFSDDGEISSKNIATIIEIDTVAAVAANKNTITIKLPKSNGNLKFNTLTFVMTSNGRYESTPVVKLILQCDPADTFYKSKMETALKTLVIDTTFMDQKISLTHNQSGVWRTLFLTESGQGLGVTSTIVPLGSDLLEYFKKAPSGFFRLIGSNGGLDGYINTLDLPYNTWYDIIVSSHEVTNYKTLSIIGSDGTLLNACIGGGSYTGIAGSTVPIGVPIPYPGATPPTGYLLLNGSSFNTAAFKQLAKVYPTGVLPDLRGEFIRGWDNGRGIDSSRSLLSAQSATGFTEYHGDGGTNQPPRNYYENADAVNFAGNNFSAFGVNKNTSGASVMVNAITNYIKMRPRNVAFNYIVRAA